MTNNLKVDFTSLEDIEIYELLLQGRISNFPSGFWANRSVDDAKDIAIKLLRYLIDEKLKLSKENVKKEVPKLFLTKYKLHIASKLFGRSAIRYIKYSYPEEGYQPWQFQHDKVPQSYWYALDTKPMFSYDILIIGGDLLTCLFMTSQFYILLSSILFNIVKYLKKSKINTFMRG